MQQNNYGWIIGITYVNLLKTKEKTGKHLSPIKKPDIRTNSANLNSFFSSLVTKLSLAHTK